MNIEDQVLSIAQVQELQELGFDLEKHASMCYTTYINDSESHEEICYLTIFRGNFMRELFIKLIPTLTIGDIMECLPKNIKFEGWEYDVSIYRNQISYYDRNIDEDIFVSKACLSLIDALFECLVWCIKEKHIEL